MEPKGFGIGVEMFGSLISDVVRAAKVRWFPVDFGNAVGAAMSEVGECMTVGEWCRANKGTHVWMLTRGKYGNVSIVDGWLTFTQNWGDSGEWLVDGYRVSTTVAVVVSSDTVIVGRDVATGADVALYVC